MNTGLVNGNSMVRAAGRLKVGKIVGSERCIIGILDPDAAPPDRRVQAPDDHRAEVRLAIIVILFYEFRLLLIPLNR